MNPSGAIPRTSPQPTVRTETTVPTTSAAPSSHRGFKQTALNHFSDRLNSSALADCQNLLRQAISGSRDTNAELENDKVDEHIRSLIDPKKTLTTSLTARKCPESAALAVIACVYKAFGDRILTHGQIDEGKLTLGLYMMFGKEMPKIKSDVLGILHKNFRIDPQAGILSSGNYMVQVDQASLKNYNTVINAKCTDPTYFYDQPESLLLEFFGDKNRIPGVLQNVSDLHAKKFTLPKPAEAFKVMEERCQKMKKGDPILSSEVVTRTATGVVLKQTTNVAFFVDSLPSIANKLVKQTSEIAELHDKRSTLIARIKERADFIDRWPHGRVADLEVQWVSGEWVFHTNPENHNVESWLAGKTIADLEQDEAILGKFSDAIIVESCVLTVSKTAVLDDQDQPIQVDFDSATLHEIQEMDEPLVSLDLPDSQPAIETPDMFKKVVNCWCKTTTDEINGRPANSSTVVFVGTQAFKQNPQDRIADARTILDEIASRNAQARPTKKKILVFDQRLLSPANEGKLWTRHTAAMSQAARDFTNSLTGQTMEYIPIHSRAEGAWAAWASWAIGLVNTVLEQLNIYETIELAPKIETDFMSADQCTAAKAQIRRAFDSMSVESQKKYRPVLEKWNELFEKREVKGHAAVFSTLSNILQDAINNDSTSPYSVQLIIGCKSGIDRSTADPVVMDMIKPLILMELERTTDSAGRPRSPDLKRFFDRSTGELCLNNLSKDEIMIVTNNHDPNLMIRLSQINNDKASNINPHILLTTMRQFSTVAGMALRTFTGTRPS